MVVSARLVVLHFVNMHMPHYHVMAILLVAVACDLS